MNRPVMVLGIMSGTSMDGLDLAICRFLREQNKWNFELLKSKTVEYDDEFRKRLETASSLDGSELVVLDHDYGKYIGEQAAAFVKESGLAVELISSHGHTIFHQPARGITFQAGNGSDISAVTGITTVSDFRRTDVALGGEGAPMVPVGDDLLFSEYDYCLNLGGFANISFRSGRKIIAYDICPVNIVLNHLSRKNGKQYDRDGETGSTGQVDVNLLHELNEIPYYRIPPPKSLGREWVESDFFSVLNRKDLSLATKMRTVYEHITDQIAIIPAGGETMLISGGGIHNKFLKELILSRCKATCVIPSDDIIDFKEAIVFAFLGLLRVRNEINCYSSVTGASRDSCCGVICSGADLNESYV